MTDKPALRSNLRATRAAFVAQLSAAQRHRLETELAAKLLAHLGDIGGKTVASYAALGDEISPGAADRMIVDAGGRIVYPRVGDDGLTLHFHRCAAAELRPGYRAIREPLATTPQARPDIILVPLVGVDRIGNRIGQGAGHYDRALRGLRTGSLRAIGLGWDVQLVARAAADPWDQPLDALITPGGCLIFTA